MAITITCSPSGYRKIQIHCIITSVLVIFPAQYGSLKRPVGHSKTFLETSLRALLNLSVEYDLMVYHPSNAPAMSNTWWFAGPVLTEVKGSVRKEQMEISVLTVHQKYMPELPPSSLLTFLKLFISNLLLSFYNYIYHHIKLIRFFKKISFGSPFLELIHKFHSDIYLYKTPNGWNLLLKLCLFY